MLTIDEFEDALDEIAETLPPVFFEELNGGIVVDVAAPQHEQSVDNDLYIMGQYRTHPAMGKYIVMFYGSFANIFRHATDLKWKQEMRKVLVHEFRHHMEGRAGMRDLEIWDEQQIASYKKTKDS